MSRGEKPVSLKTGPTWKGLGDASDADPSVGLWETLRNVMLSRDGTELQRRPGSTRVARPRYTDRGAILATLPFGILAVTTAGDPITLTLNGNHGLSNSASFDHLIEFDGNGDFDDGFYKCRRGAAADQVIIDHDGTGYTSTTGKVGFVRLHHLNSDTDRFAVHSIEEVASHTVVVCETAAYDSTGATKYEHAGSWVAELRLDGDGGSPESGFEFWPAMPNVPDPGGYANGSNQWSLPIRRKMVTDTLDERCLIAIPGAGVCMEVNGLAKAMSKEAQGAATKMLGVPRGILSATPIPTTGGSLAAGAYWVSVGFRDRVSGQLGIPSTPVQVGVAATGRIPVIAYNTTRVVQEAAFLNFVIYLSALDATTSGAMSIVYEETATNANTSSTTTVNVDSATSVDDRFPVIEVPPPGAGWVKAIRGIAWFGGMFGSATEDQRAEIEVLRVTYGGGSIPDGQFDWITTGGSQKGRLTAGFILTSAYQGQEIFITTASASNARLRLGERVDSVSSEVRQKFEGTWGTVPGSPTETDVILKIPTGTVFFSEQGFPGVVPPGENNMVVDQVRGRDVRAAGKVGNTLLLMTEVETYAVGWQRSPVGADPSLISQVYGCVSPSCVVEFEGRAAWPSHDGIVAASPGGGVQLVSAHAISDFWRDRRRDGDGLMMHQVGSYDPDHRIALFGTRFDYDLLYSAASNDVRSKMGCDTLLCWHPDAGSWSTWDLQGAQGVGSNRGVLAMKRLTLDDGLDRVCYISDEVDLGGDRSTGSVMKDYFDIYAFDDNAADRSISPITGTATTHSNSGTAVAELDGVQTSTSFTASANDFDDVRVGDEAFIRTGDDTLEWYGTISAIGGTNNDTVTLSSSASWGVGAIIVIRAIHVTMKTRKLRFGTMTQEAVVGSVSLRHSVDAGRGISTARTWFDVRVYDDAGVGTKMFSEDVGVKAGTNLTRCDQARVHGNEFQVEIKVISDSVTKIKDIVLEVANYGG